MYRVTCYLKGLVLYVWDNASTSQTHRYNNYYSMYFLSEKLMRERNAATTEEKMRRTTRVFISSSRSDNIHQASLSSVAALYLGRWYDPRGNKQKKEKANNYDFIYKERKEMVDMQIILVQIH